MGFIKYQPLNGTYDVYTTNAREKQLWQEFIMIRHTNNPKGISSKKAISPWIDQAKSYFLDAFKSDWRSAGLLYYYSFLNLAKAFIVAKRIFKAKDLQSISILHGISAKSQVPNQIIDYEIQVHPPLINGRRNIFAIFYETITGETWPYPNEITISLSEVLPYCREINAEVLNFYGIQNNVINAQSLVRDVHNKLWFELNVDSKKAAVVQSQIDSPLFTRINIDKFNEEDKNDWLIAYGRTIQSFRGTCFLRSHEFPYSNSNKVRIYNILLKLMYDAFNKHALPYPISGFNDDIWHFTSKINLCGSKISWHPLLSDYLIAFALSDLLRYRPQLLQDNHKDSFIAEAWCTQSAITSLRYFLMKFTSPSIRYN